MDVNSLGRCLGPGCRNMPVVSNFVVIAQIFKGLWAFAVSFYCVNTGCETQGLKEFSLPVCGLCVGCILFLVTLTHFILFHLSVNYEMLKPLFCVFSLQSTMYSPLAQIQSILDQPTNQ